MIVETTTLHNEKYRTHEAIMCEDSTPKHHKHPLVEGYSIWRWPEFQAVLGRLGVDLKAPTTDITITIPLDCVVSITHEFYGFDTTKKTH